MRVSFFTPWRERCGISDYSRALVEALRTLPERIEVRMVEAPTDAVASGTGAALRRFRAEEARYRALGEAMNDADLAHIQHQYFFFGGVAPHKNHATAFLDAIRIPAVMTVHEIAPETGPPLKRRAIQWVNRANLLHPVIRHWMVHTTADYETLTTLGAPSDQITVIPVGVPPALPMVSAEQAKQLRGWSERRVVTLFGFLSIKKGHRVALEALKMLPEDVLLVFAGDRHPDDHTDYVPELQREIQERGLTERVVITGYLAESEVPVVMAATDVALAPFLQSSGSASLSHLFAYGRAVVASDIPPHRELAQKQPTCLSLFPSEDARALAEAVQVLLNTPEQRLALQHAAHTYAERHSYAQVARQTCALYHHYQR